MSKSVEYITSLLRSHDISSEVIDKLVSQQMADLENLEELVSWTPLDISTALGIPIGLVMPNKFAKRIQSILNEENRSGLDQSAINPTTPPIFAAKKNTNNSKDFTDLDKINLEISFTQVDEEKSLPICITQSQASRPLPPLSPPLKDARIQLIVNEENRSGLDQRAINPTFAKKSTDNSKDFTDLDKINLEISFTQVDEEKSLPICITQSQASRPLPPLSPKLESSEPLKDASKFALGLSETCNNSRDFHVKPPAPSKVASLPMYSIPRLQAVANIWTSSVGTNTIAMSDFSRIVLNYLVHDLSVVAGQAEVLVGHLLAAMQTHNVSGTNFISSTLLDQVSRRVPRSASFVDFVRYIYRGKSDRIVLLPPTPSAHTHVCSSAESLLDAVLCSAGWSRIEGKRRSGKTSNVLSACYRYLEYSPDAHFLWLDFLAVIPGEQAVASCIASQLGMAGGSSDEILHFLLKLLIRFPEGSVVVLDHFTNDVATKCSHLLDLLDHFKESLVLVVICSDIMMYSGEWVTPRKSVIKCNTLVLESFNRAEATSFAACTFPDVESALLVECAGFLPGNIISLASLTTSSLKKHKNQLIIHKVNSSKNSAGLDSAIVDIVVKSLSLAEKLLLNSIAPVSDAMCAFDIDLCWYLAKSNFTQANLSESDFRDSFHRLIVKGIICATVDCDHFYVTVNLVTPLPLEATSENKIAVFFDIASQYFAYYTYWTAKLLAIDSTIQEGYDNVALIKFDTNRSHFYKLLTSWNSSYPPKEDVLIAVKLSGHLSSICEFRFDSVDRLKICRTVYRVLESAIKSLVAATSSSNQSSKSNPKPPPGVSVNDLYFSYYKSANDLGKMLFLNGRLTEGLHFMLVVVEEIKSKFKSTHKNYAELLARASCVLGMIYGGLDQPDKDVACFEEAVKQVQSSSGSSQTLPLGQALWLLAKAHQNNQNYDMATSCYEQAISVYSSLLTGDSKVPFVYEDLAGMCKECGEYDKSEIAYVAAIEGFKRNFGSDNASVAHAMNKYAVLLHITQKNPLKAKLLYTDALRVLKSCAGEYSEDVASTMNNLGALVDDIGDFEEARRLYESALHIRRKILDRHHPDVAASMANLAALLDDCGEFESAKQLYLETVEINQERFGNVHPDVASSVINIAALLDESGDFEDAKRYYEQALGIFKKLYGELNANYASTLTCLGHLAKKQKKYEDARLSLECAHSIFLALFGPHNLVTAQASFNIALVLKLDMRYEEAKKIFQEVLRTRETLLEDSSGDVSAVLHQLALVCKSQHKTLDAVYYYNREIEMNRKILDEGSAEIIASLHDLGMVYKNMGNLDESLKCFREVLTLRRRKKEIEVNKEVTTPSKRFVHRSDNEWDKDKGDREGDDVDVQISDSCCNVALVLQCKGNFDEAITLFNEARDILQSKFGVENLMVAKVQSEIALLLQARGKAEEAKVLLYHVLKVRQSLLPDKHPDILQCYCSIASLLGSDHQYNEAKKLFDLTVIQSRSKGESGAAETASAQIQFAALAEQLGKFGEAKPLFEQALQYRIKQYGELSVEVAECQLSLANIFSQQRKFHDAKSMYLSAIAILESVYGSDSRQFAIANSRYSKMLYLQCKFAEARDLNEKSLTILKDSCGDGKPDIDVAHVMLDLCGVLSSEGNYGDAEILYEEAIACLQSILGKEHIEVSNALACLAEVLKTQNYLEEATQVYRESLQIKRQVLGNIHIDIANCLFHIGALLERQELYAEALKCYTELLHIKITLLGEYHAEVAQAYHNIAALYDKQGEYVESEEYFREALRVRRRVFGTSHPDIAQTLNNLAAINDDLGRPEAAIPLYKEALIMYKEIFGEDHPDVALAINNLAALLDDQGEFEEALKLYEDALVITKNVYGDDSAEVASAISCLANALTKIRRFEKAEKAFGDAIGIRRTIFGPNHMQIAYLQMQLGEMYVLKKDFFAAKKCFNKAIAIKSIHLGDAHSEIIWLQNRLEEIDNEQHFSVSSGKLLSVASSSSMNSTMIAHNKANDILLSAKSLFEKNDIQAASEMFADALNEFRTIYGENHVTIVETLEMISLCMKKLKNFSDGEKYAKELIKINKLLFGASSRQLGNAYFLMASLLDMQEKYVDALKMYNVCLTIRRDCLGASDVDVGRTMNNMAVILDDLGRPEEAIPYFRDAISIFRVALEPNNMELAMSINNLAAIMGDIGRNEDGLEMYGEVLQILKVYDVDESSMEVADAKVAYAGILKKLKRYSEALSNFQEALYIKMKKLGPDSREAALLFDHVGSVCQSLRDYRGARRGYDEALGIRLSIFADSPNEEVAVSYQTIAMLLEESGKDNEAEIFWVKCLQVRLLVHSNKREFIDIAKTISQLGNVLRRMRKYKDSMELFQEALRTYIAITGENSEETCSAYCNLGLLLRNMHVFQEALENYERALKIQRYIHADNTEHIAIADIMLCIAAIYDRSKALDKSIKTYEEVLRIQRGVFGASHPDVARTLNLLAIVLKNTKSMERAEECYVQALSMRKSCFGIMHMDVAQSMNNLAALYYSEKRYDEARALYQDALVILKEVAGPAHLDVAQALNNLAALVASQKDFVEAISLYQQSLDIRKKRLGGSHLDVASSLANLAVLYKAQHEFKSAKSAFEEALHIRRQNYADNPTHPDVVTCVKSIEFLDQISIPLTVGCSVEMNQGYGKRRRGTVTKIHKNGTYEISFEESDKSNETIKTVEKYIPRYRLLLLGGTVLDLQPKHVASAVKSGGLVEPDDSSTSLPPPAASDNDTEPALVKKSVSRDISMESVMSSKSLQRGLSGAHFFPAAAADVKSSSVRKLVPETAKHSGKSISVLTSGQQVKSGTGSTGLDGVEHKSDNFEVSRVQMEAEGNTPPKPSAFSIANRRESGASLFAEMISPSSTLSSLHIDQVNVSPRKTTSGSHASNSLRPQASASKTRRIDKAGKKLTDTPPPSSTVPRHVTLSKGLTREVSKRKVGNDSAAPYKDNVGSAGFRLSTKSFKRQGSSKEIGGVTPVAACGNGTYGTSGNATIESLEKSRGAKGLLRQNSSKYAK